MKANILIVDDEPSTQFGFAKYIMRIGYDVKSALTLAEAREKIQSERFDAILLDLKLPDGNGIDWIKEIRPKMPEVAVVLITGHGDIPLAVEAMRSGADHFLTKPVNMAELEVFLHKSLELGALRRETMTIRRLKKIIEPFWGTSPAMKQVRDLAILAAESDSSVMLQGETGTGKGILARWIHEHSLRKEAQFVEINCTSLKGELLASELFGHAKGAFTSAVQDKQGLIEAADGGTLFLDEIGDMSPEVQSQFLKVIEEKQFRHLGEVKMRRSDFRLICATNKNLVHETEKRRFRNDLYFRIHVLPVDLPPLRARLEDLPGMVAHFLDQLGRGDSGLLDDTAQSLLRYDWPGNIRELKNVLERAVLLARGGTFRSEFFPSLNQGSFGEDDPGEIRDLNEIQMQHIRAVVTRFKGDTKMAAKALGMSRATLYRKLKQSG